MGCPVLFFLFAVDALQNQSPKSCRRAPPRKFWALKPPANLCSPSLSVHGSVLSLASSASSTYSSVRPLKSLPLRPPPQPFHIPQTSFGWVAGWGWGTTVPAFYSMGLGVSVGGDTLRLEHSEECLGFFLFFLALPSTPKQLWCSPTPPFKK